MKKCHKCNKIYDDTWMECLRCKVPLDDVNSTDLEIIKYVEYAKCEIEDIKSDISILEERVSYLETNLSPEKINNIKKDIESKVVELQKNEKYKGQKDQVKMDSLFKEEQVLSDNDSEKETTKKGFFFKGQKKKVSFLERVEKNLGEKWFNKLGVLAVVIGVVLLIGYSFKFFGPLGKLSVGYAFGLGLLGYGIFIEKKANLSTFGKSLIAGGWAINYFTTFAMHHIPEVRLVTNPFTGMLLLLVVSTASILHIYKYKSQLATSFSYLLMFITLMITPISIYTVCAGLLVASSLVFFMYRMKWHSFALYGIIMSYLSYMTFLARAPKVPIDLGHFISVTAILSIYWVIFSLAGLFMVGEMKTKEGNHIILTFITNSLGASLCGFMLVNNGFEAYMLPLIIIGISFHLLLTVVTHILNMRRECLIASTFAIGFSLLYASLKFSGYSLTVAYTTIAQLLLFTGIIFKESYWRQFASFLLLGIFAKIVFIDSYIMNYINFFSPPQSMLLGLNNRTLLFAGAFMVFLINQHLYAHLKKKDLISESEKKWETFFSYVYPSLFIMGTWLDLPKVLTAPAWSVLGVILLQIGINRKDNHKQIQGYILTVAAFGRLFLSNFIVTGGVGPLSYRVLTVVPVLFILYYCQSILKEKYGPEGNIDFGKNMPILYTYLVFIGVMFLIRYEVSEAMVAPLWGLITLVYVIKNVSSKEEYYLPICSIAAIATAVRAIFYNIVQPDYLVGVNLHVMYPLVVSITLYSSNVIYRMRPAIRNDNFNKGIINNILKSSEFICAFAATSVITILITTNTTGVALTTLLAIEGIILFLAGFILKDKTWRLFGLIIILSTLGKVLLIDLRKLETLYYIISLICMGLLLLFISYAYNKYKDRIGKIIERED
jgi:uncharacterized membrane protein